MTLTQVLDGRQFHQRDECEIRKQKKFIKYPTCSKYSNVYSALSIFALKGSVKLFGECRRALYPIVIEMLYANGINECNPLKKKMIQHIIKSYKKNQTTVNSAIMKIAIYSRGLEQDLLGELSELLSELDKHKVSVMLHSSLVGFSSISNTENVSWFSGSDDLEESADFLISLGGDGTMLDAITLIRNKNIPIVGINYGRLGFLAGIGKDELAIAVDALVNGTYVIDKRSLIHVAANTPLFGDTPFALNEFAIHKRDTSAMIKINTYLNGEFLNTYWSDGLIVSTPTGSTGYNLSCNGPIVFPESASFVITPIAPHNLNVRPIIVPDSNIISFEIVSRSEQFICALDARREIVDRSIELAVKKEKFNANLVRLSENNFLSTLRTKLTWGLDKRNY